jgi:adenine deaminase
MTTPCTDALDLSAERRALDPAVARAPKAELHLHIEGTLEPEMVFALARRNGVALPYPDVAALRAAYAFEDLQSFLDLYYACASVLLTEADFYDMAMAYFERAAADHVVRAEVFFDPQTHTARGVAMGDVINGLARACREAHTRWGLSAALILCFLRHLSQADAMATLEAALPHRAHFVGVGLDSSERDHPPVDFAQVFARARDLGLRVVAHAGEEGPADYIVQALDVLKVERIDHGVRCTEDPALVQRLARERIPLTVCPLSNTKLCVFDSMAEHNLPALLRSGLCVTVNADDPAYFGGYVNDNYLALLQALPELGAAQMRELLVNSITASWAPPEQQALWLSQIEVAMASAR